jgi:4-cresol dehydrogenase (hydroxylating)
LVQLLATDDNEFLEGLAMNSGRNWVEVGNALAVKRPLSREQVLETVQQARAARVPLHPVSTGLNWGYGSAAAPHPACTLLDLSGMNEILNAEAISVSNPVAVIQPGVTQGQLADFLCARCPELTFNVTGSARETSIIGNCLDRGVGYLGPRRDDLFGLEVVTGAGQVLRTGFRRLGEDSPLAHCHPFGLGPMLDGLFFQGNFGIVTSACFRLKPRPACQVGVSIALKSEADLPRFIDALAGLKREGVMGSVTHIGNKARTRASLMYGISMYLASNFKLHGAALELAATRALDAVAPYEWTSLGGLSGSARQVSAALAEVKSRLRGLGRVTVIDSAKLDLGYRVLHCLRFLPWARANAAAISAIRPLHGLATGEPTDAAIDNLLWKFGRADLPAQRLDDSNCGVLFISPALPMNGEFVRAVTNGMKSLAREHGHDLYMTLNIETESSMVAVTNLLFDRSDAEAVGKAKRCADALHRFIRSRGLEVYRARVDMMGDVVDPASEYWQTVRALKSVLDPDNIISPGRYNIAD